MKKSKRFAALFAAVLMAITMFTGSISAYAADHSKTAIKPKGIYSNLTITGWRSDNSKTNMYAKTTANYSTYRLAVTIYGKSFSYLYAAVFGTKVDKNGDNPRYVSGPGKEGKGTNSGTDALKVIADGSGDYYARVVSANVATYNKTTNSITLTISR